MTIGLLALLGACNGSDAIAPIARGPRPTPGDSTTASAGPAIRRLSVDTVLPRAPFVIEGAGFGSALGQVEVTVGGVRWDVTSVAPTRIELSAPVSAYPCAATSIVPVVVRLSGRSETARADVPLQVAERVALAAGQSANLLNAGQVGCVELASPVATGRARYVVAVINTATQAAGGSVAGLGYGGSVAGFVLRGSADGALAGHDATPVVTARSGAFAGAALATGTAEGALRDRLGERPLELVGHEAEWRHADLLGRQALLTRGAGSPLEGPGGWRARALRRPAGVAAARREPAVGDTLEMTALWSSCASGTPLRARVAYTGVRVLVLEDAAAPHAGAMDADYAALGAEFDNVHYPLLRDAMGDPLAMDAAMQGDGRVTLLFTRFVNDSLPGLAGYVTACNFYPRSTFPASNEDAVVYARVPAAWETPSAWRRAIRSTLVHEAKHLASYAERFASGAAFEEPWLEEATARIAEELYARRFDGGGRWKGNTGYAESLACELVECDGRPLIMWKHFTALHTYLRGVDTLTPLGPASTGDLTWYGSAWSLVRWAVDQYATDEGAWLRALVRGGGLTGLSALVARTGRPAGELLGDWALAHAMATLGGAAPERRQLTFPSWKLAEVMAGLAGTFPGTFVADPLRVRSYSFGRFAVPVARLQSFSASYFTFEGAQAGNQLLELAGTDGGGAGPLRLAIVRVE